MSDELHFGVDSSGADKFNRQLGQLQDGYRRAGEEAKGAGDKASRGFKRTKDVAEQLAKEIDKLNKKAALDKAKASSDAYKEALERSRRASAKLKESTTKLADAAQKAAAQTRELKKDVAAQSREMSRSSKLVDDFGGKLGTLGKGAVAGVAAAGVAFVTTKFVEFSKGGAEAARVAKNFQGEIEPLRSASADLIDDTSLQKFDKLRREIKLTSEEYENLLAFAASRKAEGLGEASDTALKALKGEAEGLREVGLVIDTSTEAYEGLTEAQKKAQVAREVAAAGAKINRDDLQSEALALDRSQVALENFISDLQVFAFETLQSSGALDLLTDVLGTAKKFFDENKESIQRLADVAVRLAEMALELLAGQLEDNATLLEDFVIPALELATDVLEIMLPVVKALLNPIDTLTAAWEGFNETLSFTNSQAAQTRTYLEVTTAGLKKIELQARITARAMREVRATTGAVGEATEQYNLRLLKLGENKRDGLGLAGQIVKETKSFGEAYDLLQAVRDEQLKKFADNEFQKQRIWEQFENAEEILLKREELLASATKATTSAMDERVSVLQILVSANEQLLEVSSQVAAGDWLDSRGIGELKTVFGEGYQRQRQFEGLSVRAGGSPQTGGNDFRGLITQNTSGEETGGNLEWYKDAAESMGEWNTVAAESNSILGELSSHFSGENANGLAEGILTVANAFEAAASSISDSAATMQAAFEAYEEGSMSAFQVGTVVAESALLAGQAVTNAAVKDKKEQAKWNMLFEGAMAIAAAARLDFVAAAGHTLAAVKFGAIAGGALGDVKQTASKSSSPERQRERREATRFRATDRADRFGDRETRSENHYHFHSLDPRGGFEMMTDTLNKGAKRRTGRYIDGRLLGSGAAGGI